MYKRQAQNPYGQTLHQSVAQDHGLDEALDQVLLRECAAAVEHGTPVTLNLPIQNVTLEHVAIQAKAGMRFEWVDGITLRDVTIEPASGNPPIIFEHCTDIIQSE